MSYVENLPAAFAQKWQAEGFTHPSIIQERAYDILADGEDLLGISPTGSGKTLAYLLPLLQKVVKGNGNQLLILLSSQELALQVGKVANEWSKLLDLNQETIIGGANTGRQIEKLKKRPEVIVGTPGRIYELIQQKKMKLMNIDTIVLDEVDQLFADAGSSITESIINHAPKKFQLAFFSATGDRVKGRAGMLSGDDLFVIDVTDEDQSAGVVTHVYLNVAQRRRVDTLRSLVHMEGFKAIVFFNQMSELGSAEQKLLYAGLPVASLASDQNKALRKAAMEKFLSGEIKFLLTTDLLSRGLDIKNLPYVVNYDVPMTEESYVHRSGRVGRMGADGTVLTFIQDGTKKDYKKIVNATGNENHEVFLYGGELVTALPEKERKVDVSDKPVAKKIVTERPVAPTEKNFRDERKPKKDRKKNRKNKGAPKGKKNKLTK
jgi:superfamily II DNA/RNA helicase